MNASQPAPEAAGELRIRPATAEDVGAIAALFAEDEIGAMREAPADRASYDRAFAAVAADPRELLVVAERDGRVVATLQLSILPGLSRRGATRGQLEAVHVHPSERGAGTGTGTMLVEWAMAEARRRGCALVQLTSDATRVDAHRFYQRLGFEASHVGFKRTL